VKASVFLSGLSDFQSFNRVYNKFFEDNPPAQTTVQAGLMAGVLLEIDAIAKNLKLKQRREKGVYSLTLRAP